LACGPKTPNFPEENTHFPLLLIKHTSTSNDMQSGDFRWCLRTDADAMTVFFFTFQDDKEPPDAYGS
jgi:hypothetical protein